MSGGDAPRRPRYAFLDAVRGLAAVAVMLYHHAGGDLAAPLARALSDAAVATLHGGWLGVQVFFVLSGFVIASTVGERSVSPSGALRFALRRQVRLDPPYWVSLAVSCAIPWAWRLQLHDGRAAPSPSEVAAHLVYLQEILGVRAIQPIYWTLAVEVQFYLALVVGLMVLGPLRRHAVWALGASAAWSLTQSMAWRFTQGWFLPHWYLFALGALAWWTVRRPWALAGFVSLSAWCALQGHLHDRAEPVAGALTALALALAARTGGLSRWLSSGPLVFLGRVSFGVYLLHPIVGAQARWLLGPTVHPATPSGALSLLVCAGLATVALAWLLHVAVERPAMRLAGRIRWSDEGHSGLYPPREYVPPDQCTSQALR